MTVSHHRNKEGQRIDNETWRALCAQPDYCVLREYKCATETIQAVWHGDGERYDFAVTIDGGRHSGIVIQCTTQRSVLALFDIVMAARRDNRELSWLASIEQLEAESDDSPEAVAS